jgi:hypothetical protein
VIEALERPTTAAPETHVDERAARRTLQAQIEHLERDLAALSSAAWPRGGFDWAPAAAATRRGPRLLSLGDLEEIRDELADRIAEQRAELAERHEVEEANRRLVEDMLRHPERHPWVRVSHADIGEPGCRHWHVVPRWGILGRLAGWWRVKISSGCPLSMAR